MKKSIRVLLAIVCLLLPKTLWAQSQEYEKVMEEQRQLSNEIDSLAADTLLCAQQLRNLQDSIAQQEQLIAMNDSLCEQLTQSLDKTVVKRMQEEVDGLQEECDSLQQTLAQLYEERSQQSERLEAVRDELSGSSDVIASIQQVQQQQQQEAKRKMLGEYWKLYDEGVQVLQNSYNKQKIESIRNKLKPLIADKNNTTLNAEQFAELDNLDICLSRFKNGIIELQKLMDMINKNVTVKKLRQEANDANRTACVEAIRKYIQPEAGTEAERIHQRYFDHVPYLKNKLRDYWNELQADPFTVPTKTEKEIKKYVIQ